MSEPPPPVVAGDAALNRASALTPEHVAAIVADFQAWLTALAASSEESPSDVDAGPDLFTLLEQLTALRHEVNLQTRATRAQQEQNAATIGQLTRALDSLQQAQAGAAQDRDDGLRPLLKTLIELYDALSVASREVQLVQEIVLPALLAATSERVAEFPEPPAPSNPSG